MAYELLVVACMRDLVSQPRIEPGPPALGMWSLTHWTTREVLEPFYFFNLKVILQIIYRSKNKGIMKTTY